ncbi:amidohydrolase family-domain-containing protein [Suillus clintonianus]|uniref:amidohydrolase family-domain-containing protein n=1 Tax=Suillus clintonianus TaxID=1904413 RepID=UPI001B867533|nr:amidohydrolase family-domain-containing protein [Suillus clintonianus]KAG2125151.1 amidohydrolase family-domain-containing protein [Suillus clintonianus]
MSSSGVPVKSEPASGQSTSINQPQRRSWLTRSRFLALLVALGATVTWLKPETHSLDYAVCSANRKVYTVDSDLPNVQCIVVHDTLISDTGDLEDITLRWRQRQLSEIPGVIQLPWPFNLLEPSLRVITIQPDSIVVPGLTDAHAHMLQYGFKMNLNLEDCTSVDEVLSYLKAYVISNPDILGDPTRFIEGMGWDQNKWLGAQYPHADDFDREPLLRGRRISLARIDVHASWVSNRVLQLMAPLPENVDGGLIIRDEHGKPTGIFVDNAMDLVPSQPFSETRAMEYFTRATTDALAVGLTTVHDAMSVPEEIRFYKKCQSVEHVQLRFYLMGSVNSDDYWGDQIPRLIQHGVGGRLTVRSVKLFTDGALGSFGAALLEPYSDNPSTSGIMRVQPEALAKLVREFSTDGWQVNIHCIGDRANHVVLDIYEDMLANASFSTDNLRPRIEHAQILTQHDIKRTGKLGVIPSVQPTHATSDMWYAEDRLGPKRIQGAYAYRAMLDASPNRVLPLGSDFPVEGINPLLGFYAAVSRLSVKGSSPHGPGGWYPSERLTRAEALKGMTLDTAYASFSEDTLGSLSIGKKADFVVLDRDIMTVPVEDILGAKVTATVIDGEVEYGNL